MRGKVKDNTFFDYKWRFYLFSRACVLILYKVGNQISQIVHGISVYHKKNLPIETDRETKYVCEIVAF